MKRISAIVLCIFAVVIAYAQGNVGIGTASPNSRLEIKGDAGTTSLINVRDLNNNVYLYMSNAGNMGIGSTNPDGKLTIFANAAASQVKLHLGNSSSTGYTVIRFGDTETGNGQAWLHRFNSGWATSGMWEASSIGFYETVGSMNIGGNSAFKVFTGGNAAGNERFRITNTGNVGINETNPGAKLDVNGNLILQNGVAVDEFSTDGTLGGNSDLALPTEKAVKTYVDNRITGTDDWTLTGNNLYPNVTGYDVAIGSTNPAGYKLHVSGNEYISGNLLVSGGNTVGNGIILSDDGDIVDLNDSWATHRFSYGLRITNANKGGSPVIQLANGASGKTYFNAGNVGIGTTDAQSLLHVMGKIDIHQSGAGGGQNRFTGIHAPTSDNGRAQLVLSSAYSDLVIASSQVNHNHGSTLTFATYNPSDPNDYRKFVINQGNFGTRAAFLDFGYGVNQPNPHSSIISSSTTLTLDGANRYVGIGDMNPNRRLVVDYLGMTNNYSPMEIRGAGTHSWGVGLVVRTTGGTDGASILFRNRDVKNWQIGGVANDLGFSIREDGGDGQYGSGFGTERLYIGAGGGVRIPNLSGSGTRMVVADGSGNLSTKPVNPSPITGGCSGTTAINLAVWYGCWASEISWQLRRNSDNAVMASGGNCCDNSFNYNGTLNLVPGNYTFQAWDSYGDGWNCSGYYNFGTNGGLGNITPTGSGGSWGYVVPQTCPTVEKEQVILRGSVQSDGTLASGGGFLIYRIGVGQYELKFNTPFSDRPTATVSQVFTDFDSNAWGGSTLDNALITHLDVNKVRIKTGDGAGNPSDRDFTIIVIGSK